MKQRKRRNLCSFLSHWLLCLVFHLPCQLDKAYASPFLAMNALSSFSSSSSSFFFHFLFFSIVSSHADPDPLPLPRALILQHPAHEADNDALLRCAAWRFAAEANNLSPWKTIPPECGGYVKEYMLGKGYGFDLEVAAGEAGRYARSVDLAGDGMEAWVFDVDDTLLSNLPYYVDHGFGLEIFDGRQFDQWVDKANAPAIESSLKLYEEVLGLGFKVFLLTGRNEGQRAVTITNLEKAGFKNWNKLIMRGADDHGKLAITFKSEKRDDMVKEGYRILGNSGDQWSDLLGLATSNRSFKLPNPMYYIS